MITFPLSNEKKNHLGPVQLIMLKGAENLTSTDQTIQRAAKLHQPVTETLPSQRSWC